MLPEIPKDTNQPLIINKKISEPVMDKVQDDEDQTEDAPRTISEPEEPQDSNPYQNQKFLEPVTFPASNRNLDHQEAQSHAQ